MSRPSKCRTFDEKRVLHRLVSFAMPVRFPDKRMRNSTPHTNSSLLQHTHSESYNKTMEDEIALTQYNKTQPVENATSRSRGKRRSRRSLSTRRRRKSSASVTLYASSSVYDDTDNSSLRSFRTVPWTPTCFTPSSDVSIELRRSPRRTVEYDDIGRLVRKRTRSVSRAQEEEKQRLERTEGTKHYCDEKDCDQYFMDIDILNIHKTAFHNALALHICQECKKSYTSAEHLQLHSLNHDNSSFFCLMCGIEMPNRVELQKHLDQHLAYSVLCKYCDKSFLSKSACNQHCQLKHIKNRCRRLYRSKQLIVDRIDFKSLESDKTHQDSGYKVYMNNYTTFAELDVNIDNLKMMNIDFYTEEDIESVLDVEQTTSQESYNELFPSSEILEDVIGSRQNCDNSSV